MGDDDKQGTKISGAIFPGLILVIIGLIFLLPQVGIGKTSDLWPAFILAPGLGFFALYIMLPDKKKAAGILIPATIATLIAIFFFYLSYVGWDKMEKLWPIFPLVVGISFYAFYFSSAKDEKARGVLTPANILLLVGIFFLLVSSYTYAIWPLVLIIVGLVMLFTSWRKKPESNSSEGEIEKKDKKT